MASYSYENVNLKDSAYVHYNPEHVDWNYTLAVFNRKNSIQNNLKSLTQKYKQHLSEVFKITDGDGNLLSLLDMDNESVQEIFEAAAEQINKTMDQAIGSFDPAAFQSAKARAQSLNSVFNYRHNQTNFDSFMSSIAQALQAVDALEGEAWNTFCLEYAAFMKGRFQSGSKKLNRHLSTLDEMVRTAPNSAMAEVMRYLSNIPKNMVKNNNFKYTARQMVGTLNNIFGSTLGEMAALILSDTIIDATKEINQAFENTAKATGKDRVTGMTNDKVSVAMKADISKNGVIDISFASRKNGKLSYSIEGEFNSSVKWYSGKSVTPTRISLQNGTSYTALARQIFGDDYAVYNNLAFYKKGTAEAQEGFNIIQRSVVSKHLEQFIAGSAQASKGGVIDTNLFLVINGKFYPIFSVLVAYIDQLKSRDNSKAKNDLVYTNFGNISNEWVGDKNVRNYNLAFSRSKKTKSAIDRFESTVKLNTSNLKSLCQKSGVQPLF